MYGLLSLANGVGRGYSVPRNFFKFISASGTCMSWPNFTRQIGYDIREFHSAFKVALKKRDNCPSLRQG